MHKVGVVFNEYKKNAEPLKDKLCEWLMAKKKDVFVQTEYSLSRIVKEADLIICLGGDGTLLKVAGYIGEEGVPVLGVNMGSLGFITETKESEVFDELESIFAGAYEVENRFRLLPSLNGNELVHEGRCAVLNDVVINREGASRYVEVSVLVNNTLLTQFGGDGVIIATATGSSGYSVSAGGPFLYSSLTDIVITPICPHSLKNRSFVIPGTAVVHITITYEKEHEFAYIILDGQERHKLLSSDTLEIRQSKYPFFLIKSHRRGYSDIVNETF